MFTECDFFYYQVFKSNSWRGVLDTTLCNILAVGRWFTQGTPVSSTTKKKNERHDIAEILLKEALNPINLLFYNKVNIFWGGLL
jgi:hypothetical protein